MSIQNSTVQTIDINPLLAQLSLYVEKHGPIASDYDDVSMLFDKLVKCSSPQHADAIKDFVDRSKGAFNSTETNQGFVCTRPHGYYGDYEIIERIYEGYTSQDPTLKRWDEYFHWSSAPRAVRARKDYCIELFSSVLKRSSTTLKILNVASGPCRDVHEFLLSLSASDCLRTTIHCVDQDANAINFAQQRLASFSDHVSFENRNIFRTSFKTQYDLVWSAGLFDYLEDRLFSKLIAKLAAAVSSGGELVIGNFSNQNMHRSYMEFGGWKLIHRCEAELVSLAINAGISADNIRVDQEPNGVNLFMHISIPV